MPMSALEIRQNVKAQELQRKQLRDTQVLLDDAITQAADAAVKWHDAQLALESLPPKAASLAKRYAKMVQRTQLQELRVAAMGLKLARAHHEGVRQGLVQLVVRYRELKVYEEEARDEPRRARARKKKPRVP